MLSAILAVAALAGVEVALTRDADKAVVASADKQITVTVTSATGIGGAELKPAGDGWPKALRLELNIKGLEGFSIAGSDVRVQTALGREKPEVFVRKGDKWDIGVVGDRDLAPRIKREGDRILIDLPADWLVPENKSLRVQWVDFYRG